MNVSFGSKVRHRTFGCVAMGSTVLFILRSRLQHPVFNPVAPYRYLLPTMYLFMTDITYPELFVCGCQTCFFVSTCCLPTPMTLASGGSLMFPLVVHQPASPSIWPAVQSLRRHKSRGDNVVRMWVQLKR